MSNQLSRKEIELAYACALASQCAYPGKHSNEGRTLYGMGYSYVSHFDQQDTQFTVFESGEILIIAFRGTELAVPDLIKDLKSTTLIESRLGSKVSAGAAEYASYAYHEIERIVLNTDKHVILSGHSLGAAAAQKTALDLFFELPEPEEEKIRLITFGCHKMGDAIFTHWISLIFPNNQRWVNANDIITKLPWQLGRFRHPKRSLHYLTISGNLWVHPGFIRVFLNRWGWFKRSPFRWATNQFTDHPIQSYIAKFQKVLGKMK